MKKKALRKEFYMEIWKTRNRFLSIFLITALGVAFFSGIRATQPDMQLSADAYYDESGMMDIRVLGTLGMTEEDLAAVRELEGVAQAEPGYSVDMFGALSDKRLNVQVMSMPADMNRLMLLEGRLPEGPGECAVDEQLIADGNCRIGDTIILSSGTDTDTEDILSETEFTIVGAVASPYYISLERGTTSIGNGTLNGFLVVPEDAFSMDYYTQLCVTVRGAAALNGYSDDYEDLVAEVTERIEDIADGRCEIRYAEVQEEGQQQIAEGEQEIADAEAELADAETELADGRAKLADAEAELADGKRELADGEAELAEKEQELLDARKKTADGWVQADDGRRQIIQAERQLEGAKAEYEKGKAEIEAGYEQLKPYEEQYAQLEEALEQLSAGIEQLEPGLSELTAGLEAVKEQIALLEQKQAVAGLTPEEEALLGQLTAQAGQMEAKKQELTAQLAELKLQQEQAQAGAAQLGPVIEETKAELAAGEQELLAGKAQILEAQAQLDEANGEIGKAVQQLSDAEKELADGEAKLADGKQELADARQEIADGEKELEEGRQELADGEAEYADAKAEADEEIADARQKLTDARQELADLEEPKWYVLSRDYIASYVDYGQNAERIGAIGKVFPVIFFLVAALVCLTTMTRMVEEERTQIGTMKALGYGRGDIAGKYILYALLSSLLGSLFGLVAGQKILPWVIINAYKILYPDLPYILTPLSLNYSLAATAAAVLCTTAAAWAACYKELFAVPAQLMRPAAPKAGKRVFLERVTPLWKRLSFSQKAAVRNLIRYKKRFFMTVFGIGGCTALLLVGFGVKDSVSYIGIGQFGNVFAYDASIGIDSEAGEEQRQALLDKASKDTRVTASMEMLETALDAEKDGTVKSAYLVVPKEKESLETYVRLKDRKTQEPYELSDDGVIISEKLAVLLDVSEGDTITLKEDESSQVEVQVAHITENYFMHYIYMEKELYEKLYEEEPEWNMLFLKTAQTDEAFEAQLQEEYMALDAAASVTFTSGTAEYIDDMLGSMDVVIAVLVIAAGLLAFVVLYNLNNINISERKRELATLKVLGFHDSEVLAYVNRENVLLTILGAAAGALMGAALHQFVIQTAETDTMMFGRTVMLHSYIYSVLLTFVFSAVVNGLEFFRLRKIDMVESLKSVE